MVQSLAMHIEHGYLALVADLFEAPARSDRTGTGTTSLFGRQLRHSMALGFPLLTTKRVHFKSVVHELLWFLSGSTHVDDLRKHNVTIWDEWATAEQCARFNREPGDLGPVYGHQWRNFGASPTPTGAYYKNGVDQIKWVEQEIRTNPTSRRLIVTGWNPLEASQVALPPCHTLFQFYVAESTLSLHLYQRSADIFLGVPFNIASYALLLTMMAATTGYTPGDLVITFGDVHLYSNHRDQALEQLHRNLRQSPKVIVNPKPSVLDYGFSDITLLDYDPHPAIKAKVAV